MLKVNRFILTLISAILLSAINLLVPSVSHAADANGQGITISPVLVELNAEPGKKYTIDIKVTNVTAGDLVLLSDANDFKAKDDIGTPEILLNDDNRTYSMHKWIEKPERIRLKSKETKIAKAYVNVPNDAEPGGHYGVVRFYGVSPELEDTGVSLSASVGTLILVRVAGDIKESATIEDFYFEQGGKRSWWFESSPIRAIERIKNTGSVHIGPTGNLELKDIFGRSVAKLPINEDNRNILPDSTRRFEQTINKNWLIGPYKATLEIAYGTSGQVLQSESTVWFIPWKIILGLMILLIILIITLRWLLRRYKARIIRKHTSSSNNKK